MISFHSCESQFSIQFSHVIVSTSSHWENQAKNWVTIQKPPNTSLVHYQVKRYKKMSFQTYVFF